MADDPVCPVCAGERWLFGMKDATSIYGKPTKVRVSRTCPYCNGKGTAKPLPVYEREPEKLVEDKK